MNKVITINLGGTAYQLEEAGYDSLRAYLEDAAARLQSNPDRDEILSDIELAIAEKFRGLLGSHKTVVETKEVAAVLAEMGPIDADEAEAAGPGASASSSAGAQGAPEAKSAAPQAGVPRRLYRIREGAMFLGVCNGIGAYLNIDPTFVRLAFALLTIFWGTGLLVYLIMGFVVPEAHSLEEKAAASGGVPPTAQEFIRRAKEGYYEAMKGFPDRKARREWRRRFKREMHWWGRSLEQEARANAERWRENWRECWAEHAPFHPGMGVALPLLTLLHGAITILCICALISLLATGTVLGIALSSSVPVWAAALLLLITYGILIAPLKAARRASYLGLGKSRWAGSFVFFLDAVIWVAVVAVLAWLGFHYFPELRDAVGNVPSLAQHAADDVRGWWKGSLK